jgi:hypothetical protein
MHGVLPRRPRALAPVFLKIGFGASWKIFFPSGVEIGSCLVEARRGPLDTPALVRRRIKATGTPRRVAMTPTCTSPK